jgi:hypothetical protein
MTWVVVVYCDDATGEWNIIILMGLLACRPATGSFGMALTNSKSTIINMGQLLSLFAS